MLEGGLKHDQRIIERYLDQPARLPGDVRVSGESALDGPVRLYAMIDLDEDLEPRRFAFAP